MQDAHRNEKKNTIGHNAIPDFFFFGPWVQSRPLPRKPWFLYRKKDEDLDPTLMRI